MPRTLTLALAVLLLAGCGSSIETTASTTTPSPSVTPPTSQASTTTPPPDLEDAVRSYTATFLGGDAPAARSLLTERCQQAIAETDFEATVAQAATIYGDAIITSYSEQVDGTVATATYQLSDPTLNQTDERWLLVDDAWRNDDC